MQYDQEKFLTSKIFELSMDISSFAAVAILLLGLVQGRGVFLMFVAMLTVSYFHSFCTVAFFSNEQEDLRI